MRDSRNQGTRNRVTVHLKVASLRLTMGFDLERKAEVYILRKQGMARNTER